MLFFFFQAEDGIRDVAVTGVQTCALPIYAHRRARGVGRPPELPSGDRCLPRPAGERIARRSVLRRQPRFSREDACRARTLRCDLAVLEREPVPLPLNWVQGISLPLSTKL